MGRLERHLDPQKVEQLLATGKFEQPRTYSKEEILRKLSRPPSDRWPSLNYLLKLEAKRKRRQRTGYSATGR